MHNFIYKFYYLKSDKIIINKYMKNNFLSLALVIKNYKLEKN